MNQITKVDTRLPLKDNSCPVTNNLNVLKWLIDCQIKSYQNKKKNLSKNLLTELKDLFGNSNTSLKLEFFTKVWILKYNELTFNVFTAKGKGTSIEIVGYDYEDIRNGEKETEIIKFLEELYSLINIE
jgi:hypothetical protein